MRAYECRVPGLGWSGRTINAATASKARYEMYLALKESWDVPLIAIRVRSCGRPRPSVKEIAQQQADVFNRLYPIGTVVRYWRGLREGQPSGEGPLWHESTVLCDHAVAWVKGCSGCVSLTHVEATTQ